MRECSNANISTLGFFNALKFHSLITKDYFFWFTSMTTGTTDISINGMMVAAKTLTLTAMDIFNNPSVTKKAKEELL